MERSFSPSERFLFVVGFEFDEEGFKGLRSEVEESGVDIFCVSGGVGGNPSKMR